MTVIRSAIRSAVRGAVRSALEDRFGGLPPLPDWVTTSNLFTNPQDISGVGGWTLTNVTVSRDNISGPYSGTFAELFTESTDGVATTHEVLRSVATITNGATYRLRFIAKTAAGGRNINLLLPAANWTTAQQCHFDLTTGGTTIVGGSPTVSMTDLGNGWWLGSLEKAATADGTSVNIRAFRLLNVNVAYTGTGAAAVYVAAVGLHVV